MSARAAVVPRTRADGVLRPLRSGIYEGRVVHHRRARVDHRFSYRIAMAYLDLSEVGEVCHLHPLWSEGGRAPISFRRADYLGDPAVPLDTAVRDLVAERTGSRPSGPVAVLTHLRTWGWLFNPITTYYCFDPQGDTLEAVVVEVTNTPWHERTAYVLPGPGTHLVAKSLHVSPFLPMGLTHRITVDRPDHRLSVAIDDLDGDDTVLSAALVLDRSPVGRRSLGRVLWRFPLLTVRVSLGIYRQALALWWKGVPVLRHPDGPAPTGSGVRRPGRGV